MIEKFSIDEITFRVLPGGFFLSIFYFMYGSSINLELNENLDFLYTFIFFCSAFIVGELFQTIAHSMEWIIDIFFKFKRPSEIFLYKNNPVITNEDRRDKIVEHLKLTDKELEVFNIDYNDISRWRRNKKNNELTQSKFWQLYGIVSETEELKLSKRGYHFVRVIMVEFMFLSALFFWNNYIYIGVSSVLVFLIFLWRSRGYARGLVFKTVQANLK